MVGGGSIRMGLTLQNPALEEARDVQLSEAELRDGGVTVSQCERTKATHASLVCMPLGAVKDGDVGWLTLSLVGPMKRDWILVIHGSTASTELIGGLVLKMVG